MQTSQQYLTGGIIALLLFLGAGYYIWNDFRGNSEDGSVKTAVDFNATTTEEAPAQATNIQKAAPPPSLDRQILFPAAFPPEAQEAMRLKISEQVALLKDDPTNYNAWLSLGIRRKQIEDYEGARQAWEYAGVLRPRDSISSLNLGILYHYHLKDSVKAEQFLKKSLEYNTAYPQAYGELHDLYRYSYKQNTAVAVDILKQGLAATNNNSNLLVKLAVYYRDEKNDSANARIYFTQARDAAVKANDTASAAKLNAEISALP